MISCESIGECGRSVTVISINSLGSAAPVERNPVTGRRSLPLREILLLEAMRILLPNFQLFSLVSKLEATSAGHRCSTAERLGRTNVELNCVAPANASCGTLNYAPVSRSSAAELFYSPEIGSA